MKKWYFIFVCLIVHGCETNKTEERLDSPPPPIPFNNRHEYDSICQLFKEKAYHNLKEGKVQIVYRDSFHYIDQYLIFESVINDRFNLQYNSKYQGDFETCLLPIMDSALASIYGKNAKDSIVQLAYYLTDSIYKAKLKRGEISK